MTSFCLTHPTRKAIWLLLTILFSILLVFQLFGAIVKRTTGGAGAAGACARTVATATNEYQQYTSAAMNAAPNRAMAGQAADGGLVDYVSDIFLYPTNIIVANGHPVVISDDTKDTDAAPMTKVWVDENDNGAEDASEIIREPSSFMASVYLYGGSDDKALTCNSISIKMTGGEIGAIFAGGYYQNVTAQRVDVNILGGSVHYVDCGSQAGPLNEKLKVTQYISVVLKNCAYRSNFPINGISSSSYSCPNVIVFDLADHRNPESYTRKEPVFTQYITQIEKKRFVMGGKTTIPADMNIDADVIVVEKNATINNLGSVSLPRCEYLYLLDGASWIGNVVRTSHSAMSFDHYTYSDHYHTCSSCRTQVCDGHIWVYVKGSNGTHTKQCCVCGYGYTESCEKVPEYYDNNVIVRTICKQCKTTSTSRLVTSAGSSTCKHTQITTVSIPHHHVDSRAEGMIEYDIMHQACRCSSCSQLLPFTLTYRNVDHYFKSLSDVSRYFKANSIISGTVRMNCDAFAMSVTDTINIDGSMTLDMCGCDMLRTMLIQSGTVNIINSMYGDGHYSHFKNSVNTKPGAVVNAKDCHFYSLAAGNSSYATFILNNVRCDRLFLYGKENITLNSSLVVERYMRNDLTANNAPSGYVIGEMKSDGTWSVLYDHTVTNVPMYLGPEKVRNSDPTTSYIALMPCPDHKINSVTKYSSDFHSGLCVNCNATVKLPHLLLAGSALSNNPNCHSLKCSECAYVAQGKAFHDYDNNGKCLVCKTQAGVRVRGTLSASGRYFQNIDDAFDVVFRDYMAVDTITLYSDQTNTKTRTFPYLRDVFTIFGRGTISSGGGARIFIEGNGHKLLNKGSISFPSNMLNDALYKEYSSFRADHETYYASSLLTNSYYDGINRKTMTYRVLSPEAGYKAVVSDGIVTPTLCSHTRQSGVLGDRTEYDQRKYTQVSHDGEYMNYHAWTCSVCETEAFEPHEFNAFDGFDYLCTKCALQQQKVVVARVKGPNDYSQDFHTLYEAWNDANTKSSNSNGATYTVQALSDIYMYKDHREKWSMTLLDKSNIVFEAVDDEGIAHTIYGWFDRKTGEHSTEIFKLERGRLTIRNGMFQGYKNCVNTIGKVLTLQGGTFKKGLFSDEVGLVSDMSLSTALPAGYLLLDIPHIWNSSNVSSSASGKVLKCPHPNAKKYEEVSPSCSVPGNPTYYHCSYCNQYVDMETGECSSSPFATPNYAHRWQNDICTHCGAHKNGIVAYQYDNTGAQIGNPVQKSDFSDAWQQVFTWARLSTGSYYKVKLESDVFLAERESMRSIPYNCDVVIDLNGHTLNFGANELTCTGHNLTIMDSSHSGTSVVKGPISQTDVNKNFVLDGVTLDTEYFWVFNLAMKNNAGIIFDGGIKASANITMLKLTMDKGCWMEGIGCASFNMLGEQTPMDYYIDQDEAIVDMAHDLSYSQQISADGWKSLPLTGTFTFPNDILNTNKVSVSAFQSYPASSCYRWHAERKDVKHTLDGCYCTECKLNTHHYRLHDGFDYGVNFSQQYKGVAYERNFSTSNEWETIYLPINIETSEYTDVCDFADIYSFGRVSDTNGDGKIDERDDMWLIADLMRSGETDVCYPYLVRPKQGGELSFESTDGKLHPQDERSFDCSTSRVKYTLNGLHHKKDDFSDYSNLFVMNDGLLKPMNGSSSTVYPHRWYVEASDPNAKDDGPTAVGANGMRIMIIGEDISEETALRLLRGESVDVWKDGQHYTLDGRKAVNTQSGIQVLNGKTIMIK